MSEFLNRVLHDSFAIVGMIAVGLVLAYTIILAKIALKHMKEGTREVLGFNLFLLIFTIGSALYNSSHFWATCIGAVLLGCWVGWLWERTSNKKDHLLSKNGDLMELYCPRCKKETNCTGTGFTIDGDKFGPTDPDGELKIEERNFHLFRCSVCSRSIWVQLVVISNLISVSISSKKEENNVKT